MSTAGWRCIGLSRIKNKNVESTFRDALLDGSLRVGGAEGTQKQPENPGDGYTSNWLGAVTFSIGLTAH